MGRRKEVSHLDEIAAMKRYLLAWTPPNEHEAAIQQSYREAIANTYHAHNKPGYKRPTTAWKARAKAFELFDMGYSPRDISPRRTGFIRRRCLYAYYTEWQTILGAELAVWQLLRQLCAQEQERRQREWKRGQWFR